MIFCIYQFRAPKIHSRNIEEILKSVTEPTRFQPGCISSKIWNNRSENGSLLLIEEWKSEEYLLIHISSMSFRRILAAMELCTEKPVVKFIDCEKVKDFEWLEHNFFSYSF